MRKEKSEKSVSSDVEFPVGVWEVRFTLANTNDPLIPMGWLDLTGPGNQGNTMKFDNNPHFGDIKDGTFSVNVINFNTEDGYIQFHILEAAERYNPSTPMAYRFFFSGVYAYDNDKKKMELNGTGTAPYGFYPRPELPGDEGDTVTWTSKGITDTPHKPSR